MGLGRSGYSRGPRTSRSGCPARSTRGRAAIIRAHGSPLRPLRRLDRRVVPVRRDHRDRSVVGGRRHDRVRLHQPSSRAAGAPGGAGCLARRRSRLEQRRLRRRRADPQGGDPRWRHLSPGRRRGPSQGRGHRGGSWRGRRGRGPGVRGRLRGGAPRRPRRALRGRRRARAGVRSRPRRCDRGAGRARGLRRLPSLPHRIVRERERAPTAPRGARRPWAPVRGPHPAEAFRRDGPAGPPVRQDSQRRHRYRTARRCLEARGRLGALLVIASAAYGAFPWRAEAVRPGPSAASVRDWLPDLPSLSHPGSPDRSGAKYPAARPVQRARPPARIPCAAKHPSSSPPRSSSRPPASSSSVGGPPRLPVRNSAGQRPRKRRSSPPPGGPRRSG